MIKTKRVKLFLAFLGIGISGANAQQAPTAAGGTAAGSGGSATYTVGQVAYSFLSNSSGSVGQGVQQAYEYLIGVDELHDISVSMLIYPNPVNSVVNVKIENEKWKDLNYQLFDVSGRLMESKTITGPLTSISMEKLSNGNYFLTIRNEKEEIKTFKLIKNI